MPYKSKDAVRWMSKAEAIEHICKVERCNDIEACRQLSMAINDYPEMVRREIRIVNDLSGPIKFGAPSKRMFLFPPPDEGWVLRESVVLHWPDHGETDLKNDSRSHAKSAIGGKDQAEQPRKKREQKQEVDATLGRKICAIIDAAKRNWPNKETWELRPMARELAKSTKDGHGYGEQTIRQILRGTYPPSRRLKIPGLSG